MPKFTYNDIVRVKPGTEAATGRDRAWVVGIFEDRPGDYFNKFPDGVIYTVEFEDGSSTEVHESSLEADNSQDKPGRDQASLPPARNASRGQVK
jgi:hypothetical protein